ncbi:5-formyltetrahydrofolate cyclo-ligase [Glutamicibacter sp. NPDC087344]|uniref:5-formyltetrahydrofolate cyclo-ligase n=1 Tax=Glutamicibacter sp. NPDC087344 TaxID=3363994 RepID=UPI0037FB292C
MDARSSDSVRPGTPGTPGIPGTPGGDTDGRPTAAPGSKKLVRAAIRAARRALPETQRADRSAALCTAVLGYLQELTPVVRSVAAYCSAPDEPDTAPLLTALVGQGIAVYVPVCEAEHKLSWVRWFPDAQLVRSDFAPVLEPVGERLGVELFQEISTLFIPALAIDAAGLRLGQGGGYYDRFLPQLANFPVQIAALVYEQELMPAGGFATDPHDAPVDLVITPAGVRRFLD